MEDFQMGGAHVTEERRDLQNQIMIFQLQLRQERNPEPVKYACFTIL